MGKPENSISPIPVTASGNTNQNSGSYECWLGKMLGRKSLLREEGTANKDNFKENFSRRHFSCHCWGGANIIAVLN